MEEHIESLEKEKNISQLTVLEYEKKTNDNANISEKNQHKKELDKKTKDLKELLSIKEKYEQEVEELKQELSTIRDVDCKKRILLQDVQNHRISMSEMTRDKNQKAIEDYQQKIMDAKKTIKTYKEEMEDYRKPVVCRYSCNSCSNITNLRISQGTAPKP
ncbi:uncharacterized protein LOC127714021 [Mytilus californianus]|uniref:uncharacterized protein LOC127714021 n=1 Tax=Mytilus californianus TaxID=6549 RepID=UPI0022479F48|nr:uncharacterized protein LOC127714021 [Mytilus californianus]